MTPQRKKEGRMGFERVQRLVLVLLLVAGLGGCVDASTAKDSEGVDNYYISLGMEQESKLQDIRRSYHSLSIKYHPDKNQGDKHAEAMFIKAQQAYAVIKNPERRAAYDAALLQWRKTSHRVSSVQSSAKDVMMAFSFQYQGRDMNLDELLALVDRWESESSTVEGALRTFRSYLQTVNDEAIWDWIDQKVPLSKNDTGLKRAGKKLTRFILWKGRALLKKFAARLKIDLGVDKEGQPTGELLVPATPPPGRNPASMRKARAPQKPTGQAEPVFIESEIELEKLMYVRATRERKTRSVAGELRPWNLVHAEEERLLQLQLQEMRAMRAPVGLKWLAVGQERPETGSEITNDALAGALLQKQDFTQDEIDAFGVQVPVPLESYIQVGVGENASFFRPVEPPERVVEARVVEADTSAVAPPPPEPSAPEGSHASTTAVNATADADGGDNEL